MLTILLCLATSFAEAPTTPYHLTARPWTPLEISRDDYLDAIEGIARFAAQHLSDDGAIIDPFLNREHQYATPYFAHALGTLLGSGRAQDLQEAGIRAMEHATATLSGGNSAIPDQHGEFFLAPLAEALTLYEDIAEPETLAHWRARMETPLLEVIESPAAKINNWRTYAMKGEWLRHQAGLVPRDTAQAFIEDAWLHRTQRHRIAPTRYHLYQDWNGDPQSHAVEAVGRGNLLALIAAGYDGPSAREIERLVHAGTEISLLLQDPAGQCPPNGRTDNHVFNDVLYQLIYDVMAEREWTAGRARRAGQYRRAALLAFQSIQRWKRADDPWTGSYSITKNHLDPELRVGYQPASQYMNYSGAVMYHLAEAYHARQTQIPQQPAPAEIGGYALAMDEAFGSITANAGGMQLFANLRGDTVPKYNTWWTPLGAVRFARVGWDSRLGPSDGAREFPSGNGITFGPAWRERGNWVSLPEKAEHYRGVFTTTFVHPLLVRCSILYAPVTGVGGPSFYLDFTITPDGVLATLRPASGDDAGLTIPILENDGHPLETTLTPSRLATRYHEDGDEQNFLILNNAAEITAAEPILSTYGYLRPVRVESGDHAIHVFVYPRNPGDPPADSIRENFAITENGFQSPIATVRHTLYAGRWAAGGFGNQIDVNRDGQPDVFFDHPCGFIIQLRNGQPSAVETDRPVTMQFNGQTWNLQPHLPLTLP